MENTKILVVDDEVLIAEDLKDNLFSFGYRNIELAHDKKEALDRIDQFNPDIVLLDIRMENETDGIDIGEFLFTKVKKPFIFITAHSDVEMIRKIVKTRPVAYITKPIKEADLFAAVSLAIEQVQPVASKTIKIRDGHSTVLIPQSSILYIESEGNYVVIFGEEKKYISRQSMESVCEELADPVFFRIHRSYLINTSKVKKYSKKEVIIGNTVLPVSRNLGEELEQHMLKIV